MIFFMTDTVTQVYNPSPWDVEVGGSEVQVHTWLHSNFESR